MTFDLHLSSDRVFLTKGSDDVEELSWGYSKIRGFQEAHLSQEEIEQNLLLCEWQRFSRPKPPGSVNPTGGEQ